MKKNGITAPNGAPPVGPYSPAVAADDFVFLSGQIGLDTAGNLVGETAVEQAHQALDNMVALLVAAGLTTDAVVKTTIFLTDMADFAAVNDVYASYFTAPFPARSTFAVAGLPRDARFEIEALAIR